MTVCVLRLFLTVLWVGQQCVIAFFPGHTYFHFGHLAFPVKHIKLSCSVEMDHIILQVSVLTYYTKYIVCLTLSDATCFVNKKRENSTLPSFCDSRFKVTPVFFF